jgi:hypothetical protein
MHRVAPCCIECTGRDFIAATIDAHQERYGHSQRRLGRLDLDFDQIPLPTPCRLAIACSTSRTRSSLGAREHPTAQRAATRHHDVRRTDRETGIPTGVWRPPDIKLTRFHLPRLSRVTPKGCIEADRACADTDVAA